jgi:hypothetical protein
MSGQRRAARVRLVLAAGALSLGAVSLVVHGGPQCAAALSGVLYLLPAILVGIILLAGRYPGERALARLRVAGMSRGRACEGRLRCEHPAEPLRGGRLIAARLSGRGPPAVAVRC